MQHHGGWCWKSSQLWTNTILFEWFWKHQQIEDVMLGEIPHQWPASKWWITGTNRCNYHWLQVRNPVAVPPTAVCTCSWGAWSQLVVCFFSYAWYSWTCVPMVRCFIFGLIIQTYKSDDVDDYGEEEEEEGQEKREGHVQKRWSSRSWSFWPNNSPEKWEYPLVN